LFKNKRLSSAKVVILMMFFTLFTKFIGFIREMLLGQTFGTTYQTDAYIIALSVPTLIFSSILAAVTTTYIPIYTKIKNKDGIEKANYFTNNLLFLIAIISIVVMIIGMLFTKYIVGILGAGLSKDGLMLANNLTQVSLFMLLPLGLIAIMTVYLQAENKFIVPAFINIPIIIVVIAALYFGDYFGIRGVMFSNIIGAVIQVIILLIFVYRSNYKFALTLNVKDSNIKEMLLLVLPVFIGTGVQQINFIVDRMLASSFGDGIISALSFANKINEMFFGLISVTIATFIFPKLSSLATKDSLKEFDSLVRTSLNTVSILVFPVVFVVLSYSDIIVKLLFERGAFDNSSTLITSNALFYFSIGMLFFGFRDVLNRTFYSMGDTKTPMRNAMIAVISNIVMSVILMNIMGYKGIALASSLAGAVTTLLLFNSLRKKMEAFQYKQFFYDQLKIFIASIGMIVTSRIVYTLITLFINETAINNIIVLISSLGFGACIYFTLLHFLKLKEIRMISTVTFNKIGLKF